MTPNQLFTEIVEAAPHDRSLKRLNLCLNYAFQDYQDFSDNTPIFQQCIELYRNRLTMQEFGIDNLEKWLKLTEIIARYRTYIITGVIQPFHAWGLYVTYRNQKFHI